MSAPQMTYQIEGREFSLPCEVRHATGRRFPIWAIGSI